MKQKNIHKLELLAPAQNAQIAKQAINCGADAVYIGASCFGARKSAGNSLSDIEDLIKYAHKFGVKIYITVNTILDDNELLQARNLIWELYNINADGIIIQDMGLLELELPPIELIASTQCNIKTLEKVKFLEKIGFKRVILARELSLEKIKEISDNTNVELETFIHGALCVSYSGNCYMSAKIGGRSANRGECAQACRRKYTLVNNDGKIIAKDKYLLSMKDFCAEKYLADLIKAGVTSFKIEGRLKDETYVKNIVLYYRRLLDKYEKSSKGVIISDFEPNVYKTFNRGYTTYFLGKKNDVFNFDTPKSIGEEIGRVSKIDKKCFEIKTKAKIFPQDGLCFINKEGLLGFLVNKVENGKIYPNKMPDNFKVGDLIYRNKNVKFESDVKNSKTRRVIPVEIEIYKTKIKATDRECEAEIEYKFDEISKNEEKMKENFIKSFKKSGESIFLAEKIIFKTDVIPFLPISAINALRSELYLKLENLRLDSYKTKTFEKTRYAKYTEVVDYRLNIHNKKALEFYKKCEVEPLEYSLENTGNYEGKELMRTKHCIRRALSMCLKEGGKSEKLFLILDNHEKYPLIFDCKNCEMVISN